MLLGHRVHWTAWDKHMGGWVIHYSEIAPCTPQGHPPPQDGSPLPPPAPSIFHYCCASVLLLPVFPLRTQEILTLYLLKFPLQLRMTCYRSIEHLLWISKCGQKSSLDPVGLRKRWPQWEPGGLSSSPGSAVVSPMTLSNCLKSSKSGLLPTWWE